MKSRHVFAQYKFGCMSEKFEKKKKEKQLC